MASQVPSNPFAGGDDYFTLLRKARQRRSSGARLSVMELTGLTETQRKALIQAQSLTDRFETELDIRQKALDDARKARQQQTVTDRRKAEQEEAARKLEKARKEMERLKTQAQAAAAAGDVERARSIAQAVKGVLRDISSALRTLHGASATAFLTGASGGGGSAGASGSDPAQARTAGAEAQATTSTAAVSPEAGASASGASVSGEDGQAQAAATAGQDLNGDGAVDASERQAVQQQAEQAGAPSSGTDGRQAAGSGVDPVLIEGQGEAARAVAIARQIVAILRAMRPKNPAGAEADASPETGIGKQPAQTQRAEETGATGDGPDPAADRRPEQPEQGRGYRGVVEQMSADVEGLALGLIVTSGQTLNIQA
ncbi:hypothetical protein [Novispirillum itersonii]|uniref:Uncharacterized protein n=1 Tax=Novispirillum itersonii TaxID=189 RepID=A0A7X0DNI2_NOVIT|nr:hypothetical protein [Novispirillum itersonii]MBB6212010.1 hypothetical protein [Novispirillum itersonii]